MKPSKVLVAACSGVILGVAAGSVTTWSWTVLWAGFLGSVVLAIFGSARRTWPLLGALVTLFFVLGFWRVSLAPLELPGDSAQILTATRAALVERAGELISGPEQAIFSAMVLGERSLLSEETKAAFNRTGTRHILAISGMHLTIVAGIIWSALISAGLWRKQAFWGSLLGIGAFVLLVGAPASAIRAGLMAALYLLAKRVGRIADAWRLLLFAAAAMVIFNPELLIFSVGFQLSFLAVLGIILFKSFFDALLNFIRWAGLRDLLSISLAAQITTWPIVAVNFGMFSSVGLAANLVAVPLLPVVMMLGLGFVSVGWASPALGAIFLWPAGVILRGLDVFVGWLGSWPAAALSVTAFAVPLFVFYYAALALFFVIIRRRTDHVSAV